MADDRLQLSPEEAIAALSARLAEVESRATVRSARLPTGTMLETFATVAPPGTLLLIGQTVQRAEYPDLWAWAEAAQPGGFVRTDTTLQLPDTRGRVLRGVAASGETVGQQIGSDTRTLTVAQLPAHKHNVVIEAVGGHQHARTGANRFTNEVGDHGGHNSGTFGVAAGTAGAVAGNGNTPGGGHNHTVAAGDSAGGHAHDVDEATVGTGAAIDLRQAALAVNRLIWC